MDFDNDPTEETTEVVGSDELLSDDDLRLPDSANMLVRLHAVRAWLLRRQKETEVEIGEAALSLQQFMQADQQTHRLRRSERQAREEHLHQIQQLFQEAQLRLQAYEEAAEQLEDAVTHTTVGERLLVEYYLQLDEMVQQSEEDTIRQRALADVLQRVEQVTVPHED